MNVKRIALTLLATLIFSMSLTGLGASAAPANGYPEWNNNPEIFQVNREEAHTSFIPYGDAASRSRAPI